MDPKALLQKLFLNGLKTCSPYRAVSEAMQVENNILTVKDQQFNLDDFPVYILAVGKASVPMYDAAADRLKNKIEASLVITSDGKQARNCEADETIAAAHPEPDETSIEAGTKAVQFFEAIPRDAMVVTLLSGGTSSLMCMPPEGVSVGELQRLFELLNNSGATIREINTVRKHCSQIKGGQLLRHLNPNITLFDLAISDVPGDDLSIIGSGPTTPDWSTYQDAYHILLEYELWDILPDSIRDYIERGIDGQEPETLKPNEKTPEKHCSYVISSARKLAERIASLADQQGINSWIADEAFNEGVAEVATTVRDKILSAGKHDAPSLLIFFGESTVDVNGEGKGGRNQELALRGALEIEGDADVTWLSAGTDGIDGPTDAAGAIVDGSTISEARERGIDPQKYLLKNDSYHFHEQLGTLLKTGPTGNNLMDLVLVLKE